MTPDEWARLKLWFGEALNAEGAAREDVLVRVRQEAPELAAELGSLLAAHEDPGPETFELAPLPASWKERFSDGVPAGLEIGRYRVVRELGRGGAGLVLLAERGDDEFHRPVALKLLRFRQAEEANRLRLERGSLARMQHGNIATLLDWGTTDDGAAWLATEFVAGESIDAYCRQRGLSQDAILELFAQVGAAVEYAHGQAVVHRDLKPGNILVNRHGVVKLLDFGISQMTDAAADASDLRRYTPRYASPEQLRGEPATAASDVYSLGVVLGQLLTGELPPDTCAVPAPLDAILNHAMDTDPARRYATVGAMLHDLERYRRHLPPREAASSWPQRTWLLYRRHRRTLVFAAVVAAIAGPALGWWRRSRPGEPGPSRPMPAINFAAQPVGQAGTTLPLRVVWRQGTRIQSVAVVTQGVRNLDFTSPDASACAGTFAAGSSCEMHIRFAPTVEGVRYGAVVFYDSQGRETNTQFILGGGQGQESWVPAPMPLRTIPGLNYPRGLSTDGQGNAYFVEAYANTVDEIPADGSQLRVLARMPLRLQGGATAVDGAGTVYFSSAAGHAIYRLENGIPNRIASVPSETLLDNNLSVDGAGNLYTSGDTGNIYMVAAGTRQVVQLYPAGRGHRFVGMESDYQGNLFCADYITNALYELPVGSAALVPIVKPDGRLYQPHAILVLANGDMLVGNDLANSHVLRYEFGSDRAVRLPAVGNQSLALYGESRLFTVIDNREVAVYPLRPAEK
ncbi:MAG TPA: protein kinase [Terriglobales bacterium]|nr:protein kinase [Terriglobales bacterium]